MFPLGHVLILMSPVENAKRFIEEEEFWLNEVFRSVNRTHVYEIYDDQLMRADALLNFRCARRNHLCGPHDSVL